MKKYEVLLRDTPTEEIIIDFQEAVYDASVCRAALDKGIINDGNGESIKDRLYKNYSHLLVMTKILNSRGVDVLGIKRITYPDTYIYDRKIKI